MKHIKEFKTYEAMIQTSSLNQLKKVKSMMKGIDIDDKVRKDIKEGPKKHHDPLKTVKTYQQYISEPFKTNQNVVTQLKESIQDTFTKLDKEYGKACDIQIVNNQIEINSPMKYILDDLSEQYGGEVEITDNHYHLKIK